VSKDETTSAAVCHVDDDVEEDTPAEDAKESSKKTQKNIKLSSPNK